MSQIIINSASTISDADSIELETDECRRNNDEEHISEARRRRHLNEKIRNKLTFTLSALLAIATIAVIAICQYNEYKAFIEDHFHYINSTKSFCNRFNDAQSTVITTPIAVNLLILYVLLYKRRIFRRDKYKYRNVGLPMIVSCWNKNDRLFPASTYGLIAFSVFNIVRYSIDGTNEETMSTASGEASSDSLINDPTGLLALFFQVVRVFNIGVRYYPVLVGELINVNEINT